MLTTAQATWRFLTSSNRLRTLQRATASWRFLNSDLLPEAYLAEIFPESRGVRLTMDTDISHPFELPYGERTVLATIVHCVRPRTVFEFGTYSGSTTSDPRGRLS